MEADGRKTRTLKTTRRRLDVSLVELVLAASEYSEDESEIFDLVDELVDSGRVLLEEEPLAM